MNSGLTRRGFLSAAAAAPGALALEGLVAPWARSAASEGLSARALVGPEFDLAVSALKRDVAGRMSRAVLVNGTLPAPLLKWREGDEVTLRVRNDMDEPTSIHWHGILLPANMDGVPGVSFPGIMPGETFVYRFPVKQSGTYWYHSHSGLQEQIGHYGPIVIEPRGGDPVAADREHVLVLSDWTHQKPEKIFATLKKSHDGFNYQRRTVFDYIRDSRREGFEAALAERAMWGGMRMDATDIADVTAAAYRYLVNGASVEENWTALFTPGERVRLRLINASAMTIFNFRIPGLAMSVVAADGLAVKPVEIDELQIGVAETYDVVVSPKEDRAYTVMAETIDRSGFARASLAPRAGMSAEIPALRPRPILTMKDMAMAHGAIAHGAMDMKSTEAKPVAMAGMDHGPMDHAAMGHGGMDQASTDHGAMMKASAGQCEMDMPGMDMNGMDMSGMDCMKEGAGAPQRHNHKMGAGVDMVAEAPSNRLADRPLGLEGENHRVLTYAMLESREPNPDARAPSREIELHLTGNMSRYMWSFDGVKFSDADAPVDLEYGERVRLTFVNDTMMNHPIHLHGMFFDVVTKEGASKPRKHTITVKPGDRFPVDLTADAPGDWAFHCHLLYHMVAGMMRIVRVAGGPDTEHQGHSGHDRDGKPKAEPLSMKDGMDHGQHADHMQPMGDHK